MKKYDFTLKKSLSVALALTLIIVSCLLVPVRASADVTYDSRTFANIEYTGPLVTDGQFNFSGMDNQGNNQVGVDEYGVYLVDNNGNSSDASSGTIDIRPASGTKSFTMKSLEVNVYKGTKFTFEVRFNGLPDVVQSVIVDGLSSSEDWYYHTIAFPDEPTVKSIQITITSVVGAYGVGNASSIVSFTVGGYPTVPPTITNLTAASSATGATLGGTVNANGSDTTVSFEYGTSANVNLFTKVTAAPNQVTGGGDTAVAAELTGLTANTMYYYRLVAVNSDNVTSSSDVSSFTTSSASAGPTFTSGATASYAENQSGTAYAAAASGTGTVAYAITGGSDSAKFAIDSSTGELRFIGAPDYEQPADADGNNVYEVAITATDSNGSVSQNVSVTVTDVNDVNFSTEDNGLIEGDSFAKQVTAGDTATLSFKASEDGEGFLYVYGVGDNGEGYPGGLYAYSGIDSTVTLYIQAPDGYTFDLNSFKYAAASDVDSIHINYASGGEQRNAAYEVAQDGSNGYSIINPSVYTTTSESALPINDVSQVVITANGYVELQDLEMADIKPVAAPPVENYEVTYSAGDHGSLSSTSETVADGDSPANVPAVTAASGYKFAGWSADGGATLLSSAQVKATTVSANVAYTAYYAATASDAANSVSVNPETVQLGSSVALTAAGDRQSASGTAVGDERYIPVSWVSTEGADKNGTFTWDDGSYKATYTPAAAGTYTVTATFQKQEWDGDSWESVSGGTATKTASVTVEAVSAVTVQIGSASGVPGDTVTVPVSIAAASTGVGSYGVRIAFDSSVLEVVDISDPNDIPFFYSDYDNTDGWLEGDWADLSGGDTLKAAGDTLFNIEFKIKAGAAVGDQLLTVADVSDILQFTVTDGNIDEMDKTLLPGGITVNAPSATEITEFDAIADVNAGEAGNATYADAAAVQAALPASVKANDGSVTVPVTSWTDTDSYDPSTPGSYTFTAVLGTLPAGYANSGNHTATIEVVVKPREITGFDAIANVNAGEAGLATYADAAAVQAALPTSVKANDGAVTVPVASWTDTDSYDPSTPGSYTFTAVLGTIPAGYANSGNHTATVEVVVKSREITEFDAIADVNAGEAGQATYADAAAVQAALPTTVTANGNTVTVPVASWTDTDSYNPNTPGSYTFTANLGTIPSGYANTGNHTATVEVVVKPRELTGFDAIADVNAGEAGRAAYADAAAVQAALPTTVTANGNTVTVPVASWTDTDSYNPNTPGSYTFTANLGTIPSGYANTGNHTATVEVVVKPREVTGFDAIADVNAGEAGRAAYADAEAVQAALPTSVTANDGAVTVPVASWTDTDSYDPSTPGSYTFTAVLGTLPAGYANRGNHTATVEVVVKSRELTGFDAIANVNVGEAGQATYADATAVKSALPAIVTANDNTVTVPVASWTDTDSYDPNTPGSYTFTAVLGTIPAGYANSGKHTATVEVVVKPREITGFDAIADVNAGEAGRSAYADATTVISALPTTVTANDNTVTVSVASWTDTDSYDPSTPGSYTFTANLGTIPAGYANSGNHTATVEVVVTPSVPSTSPTTPGTPESSGVEVLVNGKVENAGTAKTTQVNNRSVTTITVDEQKLKERLASEGQGAVVTIPVNSQSDVVVGELNGQMVKDMENQQATLEIRTEQAAYTLPAQQIDISAISDQFGASVALQDINVYVQIAEPSAETVKVIEQAGEKGAFALVVPSVEFSVQATYGDKTVEISKFNAYVERTIAIPDGVDPNKITTGIVMEADGTVRHVPTKIVFKDGRYYAVINSLTNSVYSVVWHPIEFADVANHWAKDAVNDMGSRMVIDGVGNGLFNPDRSITRAEFAAIIVRGLGLKLEEGAVPFSDVGASAWYAGAIKTAGEYGLINGFEDGTFRPNDRITREQAMAIIAKAMTITKLQDKLPAQTPIEVLRPYADAENVSTWAAGSVADSVRSGIVSGRDGSMLAPKAFITRAEVAVMIQRLLQKSGLI